MSRARRAAEVVRGGCRSAAIQDVAVHIRLICAPPRTLPTHLSAAHTRQAAAVVETPVVLFRLQADPAAPVLRDRGPGCAIHGRAGSGH